MIVFRLVEIGCEEYFQLAERAIPRLSALYPSFDGQEIEVELNGTVESECESQPEFVLGEKSAEYKPRLGR